MSSNDASKRNVNEIYVTLAYNYFNPAEHQEVVFNGRQVSSRATVNAGFLAQIRTMMYNAADRTILGKTKEKWLFILLGIVVIVMVIFLFVNLFQRFHSTSASEFTSVKCNKTGKYYVAKRKLE